LLIRRILFLGELPAPLTAHAEVKAVLLFSSIIDPQDPQHPLQLLFMLLSVGTVVDNRQGDERAGTS
jgi:hypothetical protein